MRFKRFFVLAALTLAGCATRPPSRIAGPQVRSFEVVKEAANGRLLSGFYEDSGGWRWTAPSFAVLLDTPTSAEPTAVFLDCTIPVELEPVHRPVTVTVRVNGVDAGRETYTKDGHFLLRKPVPAAALAESPARVEFTVSHPALGPPGQPRGLIALAVGFEQERDKPEYKERVVREARAEYDRVYGAPGRALTLDQDKELKRLFHDTPVWTSLWFHGIPILKSPLDLWTVQQILDEVKPDFVIETGTFKGGSALFLAHVLEGLGLTGSRVLTIDINDLCQPARAQKLWARYVDFYFGSSTDPKLVAEIGARVRGKKVFVMLDSDHSADHVSNELRAYAPMVSSGSYIVVEDTHLDGVPTQPGFGPGPMVATMRFLEQGGSRDFEVDRAREPFVATYYPGGWLRRR